ncbi:MAG: acetoacetate--CoA ligase [Gammaproteobacteria bacterium]|nr:acetoacetate--CoA ligase [Gammaproteobacteria bacterium]
MSTADDLWSPQPERARAAAMFRFMRAQSFETYAELYEWSVRHRDKFWLALAEFCDVNFASPASQILSEPGGMRTARWFVDSRLSYAEHLLRHSGDRAAIVFRGENGARRELSFDQLRHAVADCAAGLRAAGIEKGDRVVGFLPNCPETVVAMLATSSVGAIWTSSSPDFGASAVIDRFGQTAPKLLFCADGYCYNGKQIDSRPVITQILAGVPSIESTVLVDFIANGAGAASPTGSRRWDEFLVPGSPLEFEPMHFDDPLFILYSSGTTGVPKCIVHGVGGTLLQHLKEHVLHTDVGPQDCFFYFTTCGWMMWNWLASGLASGATLMLYDGSPFYNDGQILWDIAEQEGLTIFGTSAKYIAALEKAGLRPCEGHDLSKLRCVLSTGSPLAPASFDYVYRDIAQDIQLSSISGGTDLLGCFALGNPMGPVRRGELQCRGLGMAVEVYNEAGAPVVNEVGDLVCTQAFPSMPVGFWNDPDGERYRHAYFDRFPGVWTHGDLAELTADGGMKILGRSDAVLNPGGVRIGTAEIYRQVDTLPEIVESVAIGQSWDNDVRIVLFVVLQAGVLLDESLANRIRSAIRENTSHRHVPAKIIAVADIPKTKTGKTAEIAVRNMVHGEPVRNREALANPESLGYFDGLRELQSD